jgi:hypothetical protein
MGNVRETIPYINSNLETLALQKLGFFGGDLNVDGTSAQDQLVTITSAPLNPENPYSRVVTRRSPPLNKLIPAGSGYTHVSFKEQYKETTKSKLEAARAKTAAKLSGKRNRLPIVHTYKLVGYTPIMRLLDFAYVDDLNVWSAGCDASISSSASRNGDLVKPHRISLGERMRSDHFPVFYTYNGDFS